MRGAGEAGESGLRGPTTTRHLKVTRSVGVDDEAHRSLTRHAARGRISNDAVFDDFLEYRSDRPYDGIVPAVGILK